MQLICFAAAVFVITAIYIIFATSKVDPADEEIRKRYNFDIK